MPRSPTNLLSHEAVIYEQRPGGATWVFRRGGTELPITFDGRVRVSAAEGVREGVLAGLGFAVASEWLFAPEPKSGAVKSVLGIGRCRLSIFGQYSRRVGRPVAKREHLPVSSCNRCHVKGTRAAGEGVRVLTRTMKRITQIVGAAGAKLRDRSRSVKLRLLEIARVARSKGQIDKDKLEQRYRQLLASTSRVVGQAKRFAAEIVQGVKRAAGVLPQLALDGLRRELDHMVPLVQKVMHQTRARILHGNTRVEGKILSLFEPSTLLATHLRHGLKRRPNFRAPQGLRLPSLATIEPTTKAKRLSLSAGGTR